MAREGEKALVFALKNKDGMTYSLSDIEADYTLIFFYPKDDTPGCTIEAKGFSDELAEFKKLGVSVLGISGGDEKSKQKFCEKHQLDVLLLSDPDFEVSKQYGVYAKKSFMGKSFLGINRKTFILDRNKKILKIFDKVSPKDHVAEVLEFLRN